MDAAQAALAEALSYLEGLGPSDAQRGAAVLVEQLAARGFAVQPVMTTTLTDLTPETLRRVRRALGVTRKRLAEEASVTAATVSVAERDGAQPWASTLQLLADALVRLGATRA